MSIKKSVSVEDQSVSLTFEDGQAAIHALNELKPETVVQLALHGLSQKLGDSYAGAKDKALELSAAVWKNLIAGDWTVRGEGGVRVTQLARALVMKLKAEGQEITEADAAEKLKDIDDDSKKAITAALASELAQIKAADAAIAASKAQEKADSSEPSTLDIGKLLGGKG